MAQFSNPAQIGHNSVQIPHNGVLVKAGQVIEGAKFKAASFFRPTGMSLAMADAGVIPAPHMIRDMTNTALLRHKRDNLNIRPSVRVAF